MSRIKKVKDIMIHISKYPNVPYWISIGKAAKFVKLALLDSKKRPSPLLLLVLDDDYNLMGTVALIDILKEIEPADKSKKLLNRPVSEIMTPIKTFVLPGDPIDKAALAMTQNNIELLPVFEDKKKFIGLVQITEVFTEISNMIIE